MDEIYMYDIEVAMLKSIAGTSTDMPGYFTAITAKKINNNKLIALWLSPCVSRYHEVTITIPKDQILYCIYCIEFHNAPYIFVKSGWLKSLHKNSNSCFVLIDAIDVTAELFSGHITNEKLVGLRKCVDNIANNYPEVGFISFADTILLKSNWTGGCYKSGLEYSYNPEIYFNKIIPEIRAAYQDILKLRIYVIFTQGTNAYYNDKVVNISDNGNHIGLNSLGVPFAQLMDIDKSVRKAIEDGVHKSAEIYMDSKFYRSLSFQLTYDVVSLPKNYYSSKLDDIDCYYVYTSLDEVINNLKHE